MQVIVDAVAPGTDPAVRLEQLLEYRRRVRRSRQAHGAAIANERELGIVRGLAVVLEHHRARLAPANRAACRPGRRLVDAAHRFKGLLQGFANVDGQASGCAKAIVEKAGGSLPYKAVSRYDSSLDRNAPGPHIGRI